MAESRFKSGSNIHESFSAPNLSGTTIFARKNPLSQSAPALLQHVDDGHKVENLYRNLIKLCCEILGVEELKSSDKEFEEMHSESGRNYSDLMDCAGLLKSKLDEMNDEEFEKFALQSKIIDVSGEQEIGLDKEKEEEFLFFETDLLSTDFIPQPREKDLINLKQSSPIALLALIYIRNKYQQYEFQDYACSYVNFVAAFQNSAHAYDDLVALEEKLNLQFFSPLFIRKTF